MDYIILKDILIGISALIGMILGIYNLFHSLSKEKVKLKIIPKSVMGGRVNRESGKRGLILAENDFSKDQSLFGFEIINKSNFVVTIDEIGFIEKGNNDRLVILEPILGDKGNWPRELNPRTSFMVYGNLQNLIGILMHKKIKYAYVKTACDNTRYGKSKALRLLSNYAKTYNRT